MSISFKCGSCGRSYKVDDKLSGKKAKCACGQSMTVPQKPPQATPAAPPDPVVSDGFDVLGSLNQDDLFAAPLAVPSNPIPAAPRPAPRPASRPAARKGKPNSKAILKWAGIGGGAVAGLLLTSGLIYLVVVGVGKVFGGGGERRPAALTFRGEMGEARTTAKWLEMVRAQQSGESTGVISRQQTSGIETWLGPDPAAIPDLFDALRKDKPGSRSHQLALAVLRRFDREQVKPLRSDQAAGLDDPHPEVQTWSVRLLRLHGTDGKEYIAKIVPFLKSTSTESVSAAARTLAEMGDEGMTQVLDALKAASSQKETQTALVVALREAQGTVDLVVPVVVQLIGTGQNETRLALSCLQQWEGRAARAVPELVARLEKESDDSLRDQFCATLVKINTGVPEAIVSLFKSANDANKIDGLEIASKLKNASTAAPFLDAFLQSENAELQLAAVLAVGNLGAAAKPLLPRLVSFLSAGQNQLAASALQSLAGLGSHAAEVAPSILELLKNPGVALDLNAINQILTGTLDSPQRTAVELAEMVKWGGPQLLQAAAARLKQVPAEKNAKVVEILTEAKKRVEDQIAAWERHKENASRGVVLVFRDKFGGTRELVWQPITAADIATNGNQAFLTKEEFITRQQVVAGLEGPIEEKPVVVPPLDDAIVTAPAVITALIDRFK